MRTLFKLLLILLVLANLALAAVWFGLDQGLSARLLPPPPPTRVDLGPWPLRESSTTAAAEDQAGEDTDAGASGADDASAAVPEQAPSADSAQQVAAAQPAEKTAPAEETAPAIVSSQVIDCVVLGPFSSAEEAAAAAARITAAGGQAAVEQEPTTATKHMVYVEPASSERAAATLEALAARSIDAYVIPSGPRRNGISVGVFSKRELAEAQRERVAALGYDVAVHPRGQGAHRIVASQAPVDSLGEAAQTPCG